MNRWAGMLADLPATAQRLIARHQRVSLPRSCPADERLRRLRAALCRGTAVRAVYLALTPDERAAIQDLRARRGGIRPDELARRFGALRPWSQLADDPRPRTIAERLVLLGWLIPRPAAPHNPAHLLVPPELRQWLPCPLTLPTLGPAPDSPGVAPVLAAASALLLAAASDPLPLRADGRLRSAVRRRLGALLAADLGDPASLLTFTLPLLVQLGLLSPYGGVASVTPAATPFLGLSLAERLERLRNAWVGLPAPDPWVLVLRVDPRGIDWPTLRRRLIAWAEALPIGQVVPADGLFAALRAAFGPLADAQTHGFRRVRRVPWGDQRAAQVWEQSARGPLTWLGFLAHSSSGCGDDKVSGCGDDEVLGCGDGGLSAPQQLHSSHNSTAPQPHSSHSSTAVLYRPALIDGSDNRWIYADPGQLRVPYGAGERDLLGLAPGLSLECSNRSSATYRLDAASLARAAAHGQRIADGRTLLQRHAGPEPGCWLAESAWTPPTVQIAPVLLVQASDPAVLERAARQRTVRRRLARRLAPGLALVNPEDAGALTRALERQGLAAALERPDPVPVTSAADLPPGTRAALLVACAFFRRHGPATTPLAPPEGLEQRLRGSLPPPLRAAADSALRDLALPQPPAADPIPWEPPVLPEPATLLRPANAIIPIANPQVRLRQAIATRQTVTLRYCDAAGAETERLVRPLDLYQQGAHWYLQAHCTLADAERTFRVDRIVDVWSCRVVEMKAQQPASPTPPHVHHPPGFPSPTK